MGQRLGRGGGDVWGGGGRWHDEKASLGLAVGQLDTPDWANAKQTRN